MALEKKQVLPNRFRYKCDNCPFEWPRTRVKESELLPPPTHSCPNKDRPDMKAIVEKHEKRASGSTRPRPVAVCTRYGEVSYATDQINGQCAQRVAGKRCVGVNGSALNADDWNWSFGPRRLRLRQAELLAELAGTTPAFIKNLEHDTPLKSR